MDLVTFLRDRLGEDEAAARAVEGGGRWRYEDGDSVGAWTLYDEHWKIASLTTYRHTEYDYSARMPAFRNPKYVDADANGAHIARHDPARVLREVEAKRRIVNEYERQVQLSEENVRRCVEIGRHGWDDRLTNLRTHGWELSGRVAALKFAVEAHALSYSDHPDYNPEWRP